MQPKIAIGCPVRNRAWVLPEYLEALLKIDVPNTEDLRFIFLDNDSLDETGDLLYHFWQTLEDTRDGNHPHGRCKIETINTGAEHWNHGDYAHEQYANLARVRNHFLDMFLKTDADFLLSVDSDVIVPPDIVTRLLRHLNVEWFKPQVSPGGAVEIGHGEYDKVIVGAAISNVPGKELDGRTPGNFMVSNEFKDIGDVPMVPQNYFHPPRYPMHGVLPVTLIGAVYLIPRAVIEAGARYAPHPTGEDAPFCEAARRLGYRLLVDMDVRCEHRMVKV